MCVWCVCGKVCELNELSALVWDTAIQLRTKCGALFRVHMLRYTLDNGILSKDVHTRNTHCHGNH